MRLVYVGYRPKCLFIHGNRDISQIIEDNLINIVTTHARHVGMCHIVQNLPHIVFVLVHEG